MDEQQFTQPGSEDPTPTYDAVLAEYLDAESPEDWLVDEVCGYLFQDVPPTELEDRLDHFDAVMHAERSEMFADEGPGEDDVVLFTVTVDHGADEEYVSFPGCPSAALLLEACVHIAAPGECVRLDVVYGDGTHTRSQLRWPFPMQVAVAVTTPVPSGRLADELERDGFGPHDDPRDRALAEQFGYPELDLPVSVEAMGSPTPAQRWDPTPRWQDPTVQLAFTAGITAGLLGGLVLAHRMLRGLFGRS